MRKGRVGERGGRKGREEGEGRREGRIISSYVRTFFVAM